MKLFISFFIASLFMDVLLNYALIRILTNRVNIIPITPKLAAPKLLLHFGMQPKQFSCSNTFYDLRYLFGRHHGNTLHQKMNMILIRSNLNKVYFKSFLYILTYFNQTLFYSLRQNTSPIFYRTNQMVQQQTFVMTFINMFTHNTNLIQNTNSDPAAS